MACISSILNNYRRLRIGCFSEGVSQIFRDAFQELEKLAIQTSDECSITVLNAAPIKRIVPDIRRIRATYEYRLELGWALQAINSKNPRYELQSYTHYTRNKALADSDIEMIRSALDGRIAGSILFVGCGPFPISAIIMARYFNVRIDCIDSNREACQFAVKVAQKVGMIECLNISCCDVIQKRDLAKYDVIVIAALVGISMPLKSSIIRHVLAQMKSGSGLLARTATGLRRLFYAEIRERQLSRFVVCHNASTENDVLASSLIAWKQ